MHKSDRALWEIHVCVWVNSNISSVTTLFMSENCDISHGKRCVEQIQSREKNKSHPLASMIWTCSWTLNAADYIVLSSVQIKVI